MVGRRWLLQISRYVHARGALRTICLHRRQTRPSIAGALQSSLAWSSNTTASISLGSTSCITGGDAGSILKFDRNRTVVVGIRGDVSPKHPLMAIVPRLKLAQTPRTVVAPLKVVRL